MSFELGHYFPNITGLTVIGVDTEGLMNGLCNELCITFSDGSSLLVSAPWEDGFRSSFSIESKKTVPSCE